MRKYKHKSLNFIVMMVSLLALSFLVFGDPLFQERSMTLVLENQFPNITNVELNDNISSDDSMLLTANETTRIWCAGNVFDLDGYPDVDHARAVSGMMIGVHMDLLMITDGIIQIIVA